MSYLGLEYGKLPTKIDSKSAKRTNCPTDPDCWLTARFRKQNGVVVQCFCEGLTSGEYRVRDGKVTICFTDPHSKSTKHYQASLLNVDVDMPQNPSAVITNANLDCFERRLTVIQNSSRPSRKRTAQIESLEAEYRSLIDV